MKTISNKLASKIFFDALCDGLNYFGGYGISLDYSDEEYKKAKQDLLTAKPNEMVCREDVWIKILTNGGTLIFQDDEGDETKSITIEDVYTGMLLVDKDVLRDAINEEGDADTYDVILQTIIWGEVTFG